MHYVHYSDMSLLFFACVLTFYVQHLFLPRDAMHTRGLCHHAVSVCLSVCLSRLWIMSK